MTAAQFTAILITAALLASPWLLLAALRAFVRAADRRVDEMVTDALGWPCDTGDCWHDAHGYPCPQHCPLSVGGGL